MTPGELALRAAAEPGRLDLLVTDVRMSGMQGPELAAGLRHARPGLRVLLMTGLADELPSQARDGTELVQKPFDAGELARATRRAVG